MRKAENLSQRVLADELALSRLTISKLQSGECKSSAKSGHYNIKT
ncbi:hypothetical protein OBK25_02945 [Empedobacter falsenii]